MADLLSTEKGLCSQVLELEGLVQLLQTQQQKVQDKINESDGKVCQLRAQLAKEIAVNHKLHTHQNRSASKTKHIWGSAHQKIQKSDETVSQQSSCMHDNFLQELASTKQQHLHQAMPQTEASQFPRTACQKQQTRGSPELCGAHMSTSKAVGRGIQITTSSSRAIFSRSPSSRRSVSSRTPPHTPGRSSYRHRPDDPSFLTTKGVVCYEPRASNTVPCLYSLARNSVPACSIQRADRLPISHHVQIRSANSTPKLHNRNIHSANRCVPVLH